MSGIAKKTEPKLWERVKTSATQGDKGGRPGQWSARKAQLAVAEYKKAGGNYEGRKAKDNHLGQWTKEDWGTKSGKRSTDSGERYLPKKARAHLDSGDYQRTTAKKRQDSRRGQQFSSQPADVARKAKPFRDHQKPASKAELYAHAQQKNFPGRSRMTRDELEAALS